MGIEVIIKLHNLVIRKKLYKMYSHQEEWLELLDLIFKEFQRI